MILDLVTKSHDPGANAPKTTIIVNSWINGK